MYTRACKIIATAALICLWMAQIAAEENVPVATIDGTEVSREQFELGVYNEARQTFYHGRPMNDARYVEFRKGVADKLVGRILLLHEAKRLGIEPDHDIVAAELAVYKDRYADMARWQSEGEEILSKLRQHLEEESVLGTLERQIKTIGAPKESEVRNYYEAFSDKFTEPEQIRVAVILLAVDPSSAAAVWEAARHKGSSLVQRIRAGESFSELARLHSSDPSGKNGGDMGYVHAGMLTADAQQAISALAVGELSDPVTVLEGIAIFRLTGRKKASLQPFATVRQRATDLWQRDESENRWNQTIARLRSASDITMDEAYLQTLPVRRQ